MGEKRSRGARRRRWSSEKFAVLWKEAKSRAKDRGDRLQTRHLAEPCEVTNETIYNWRKGKTQPNADQLLALAFLLECEVLDFTE